jgi:hypothetical protein
VTTAAEIDALYESTLKPRLQALEGSRRALRGYLVRAGICIGVPFALFFLADVLASFTPLPGAVVSILSFALIFVGVLVAAFNYLLPGAAAYMNYRTRFKHEVAAEVFKIVCPTATYAPTKGVTSEVFDEPGIFNTRGGYTSDDRVRGTIGATPFEAADVSRSYSTGGKNSRTVVVFRGLFFHLDFNKRLTGTTIVQPTTESLNSTGSRSGMTKITLENPTFEAAFEVYATDEVEARYILTPAMMERILSLAAITEKPIYLGFKGNRAYLGVNNGRALFEPGIAATTSVAAIHEMAAHFALAEGVVDELDLNTRIWTKDVDASLLHVPDDPSGDTLEALAARGDVSAAELWAAASKAIGDGDDAPEDVPKPPDTSIDVEHGGGRSVVRYPLTVGFFIAVLLTLAAAAVWSVSTRSLPEAMRMPELARWTSWLPDVASMPDIVRQEPLPFFFVASAVVFVTLLMWALRVRKVEVRADAVAIARGLRPWPRRYARPLYGKVVRVDKAVFIAKTEGLSLVNVSASPMLTDAEATWVAAELRRALRTTAH